MKIVGMVGSLRAKSLNGYLFEAARELAPAGVTLERAEIGDLPLYNEDLRDGEGFPASVVRLRAALASADALLFVSPEYNYSTSGVLKNAIDWASRPPHHPFAGKPASIMTASPGVFGGARAQYHLRQMVVYLNVLMLNGPEVMVGGAGGKFDEAGRLTDGPTRDVVRKHLEALVAWTNRLKAPS